MTRSEVPATGELPATPRHRTAFAAAALVAIALDQLSKHWALAALDDGAIESVGSLRLKLTFNDGAAFSIGSGHTTLISLVALAVAAVLVRLGLQAERRLWAVGLGAILGGAVGNLVDRAFRAGDGFLGGRVVDFIDLQWWPVFNVADVSLWVGIGLLGIASLRQPERGA